MKENFEKALPFIIGIVVGGILLSIIQNSKIYKETTSKIEGGEKNGYEEDRP